MNYFAIIGAQRSGTSFLYRLLDEHPQIRMAKPLRPEPKYFLLDEEFKKGKEYYQRKFFSSLNSSILSIGEKATSYLEFPNVGERIQNYFPEAKVLVILRHPVKRALSNYFFSVKHGVETRTAEDVFLNGKPEPELKQKISVSPFHYIGRGHYHEYLDPYMQRFGTSMKVVIFEELTTDPTLLSDIYSFLDVEEKYFPKSYSEIENSAGGDYSGISSEVYAYLNEQFRLSIPLTEKMLSRKIPSWYDKIQ